MSMFFVLLISLLRPCQKHHVTSWRSHTHVLSFIVDRSSEVKFGWRPGIALLPRISVHAVLLVIVNATEKKSRRETMTPAPSSPPNTTIALISMVVGIRTTSRYDHRRRPRRPPFLRVLSEGVGVTSSIRPIFMPERARARRADWAPGPGVLVPLPGVDCQPVTSHFTILGRRIRVAVVPPVARILMCLMIYILASLTAMNVRLRLMITYRALMPSSLQRAATS